ncbi:MAG: LysR family transcriptional regulator [Solirubrobacterales bacterium]|nr:LysR family transcriptional regulator [Solirubrobacterales bacterium]
MSGPIRSPAIAELRAFCAAVDLGSLGRAARLLQVSQPALSQRIRGLEGAVGIRLLERSPRGVTPTTAGARLYAAAQPLLAEGDNLDSLLAEFSTGSIPARIAASHTIAEFALAGPLTAFEIMPEGRAYSTEMFVANSRFVRRLVREGHAELGIAARDPSAGADRVLEERPYCEDEVVAAVPDGHPWAAAEEVEVEDFVGTRMVMRDPGANSRRVVESALAEMDLSLAPPLAEVGSTSAAKSLALTECAPVLLSRLAFTPPDEGLVVRPVRGLHFLRQFVVVFATSGVLSRGAQALLSHLLEHAPGPPERR